MQRTAREQPAEPTGDDADDAEHDQRGDEHRVQGGVALSLELRPERTLHVGRQVLQAAGRARLVVEDLPQEEIYQRDQDRAGKEERSGVEEGESDPDRGAPPAAWGDHGMRYPLPWMVSMTGGSPSFRRTIIIVNQTTPVNGSACSSHARSRSCSAETTPPSARSSSARTANSFRDSPSGRPSRVTVCRYGSSRMPARSRTGGAAGRARLPSAWTRAVSSANANGLVR